MVYKTEGIVLQFYKYGETSIIAKIFTKKFGLKSYIINGVRKDKPRYSSSMFYNLSLINMVVYNKKNASLQRVSTIEPATVMHNLMFSMHRFSIAIFISEILIKTVYKDVSYELLFDFVKDSITELNSLDTAPRLFLLRFMVQLSKYLGFGISSLYSVRDMILSSNNLSYGLDMVEEEALKIIIDYKPDINLKINRSTHKKILACLINFYKANISTLTNIKSINIFKEIM